MKKNVRSQCRSLQDVFVVYVVEVSVVIQCGVLKSEYTRSVIKGGMYKVIKSLISSGCSNSVTSTGHTSIDLEVVEKFCYLGDKLSMDGDADVAVKARS